MKERFIIKQNRKDHARLKKLKQKHVGKTLTIPKFQNLIGKANFVCPRKFFTRYLYTKLH